MPPQENTSLLGSSPYQQQKPIQYLDTQKSWDYDSSVRRRRWRRAMDMLIGFAACAVIAMVLFETRDRHSHTNKGNNSMYDPKRPPALVPDHTRYYDNDDDNTDNINNDDDDDSSVSSNTPLIRGQTGHHPRKKKKHPASASTTALTTSPSKYSKFQALGFQIYTGGAPALLRQPDHTQDTNNNFTLVHNPECNDRDTFGYFNDYDAPNGTLPKELWQCYLGLDNPMEDVQHRLQIMQDAVEAAYDAAAQDSDTLKIFVAPEFFWRGQEGAYLFDHVNNNNDDDIMMKDNDGCTEVCQILKGLEAIVANKKYQDWLFVFGTVIASEPLPTEDDYDYLFYNFAPVYKGYNPDKQDHLGKRFLVPKRYVSNLDFLTPVRQYTGNMTKELVDVTREQREAKKSKMEMKHPNKEEFKVAPEDTDSEQVIVGNPWEMIDTQPFYDSEMWYEYKNELSELGYEMIEYDWLILDNITFTLEVCLDHQMKTALNAYLADTSLGSPTRIPKSVETWDPIAKKMIGGIEHVKIPRHQAQISVVSSAGMNANPDSLALVHNGSLILQDGNEYKNGSMTWEQDCDLYSWHFKGGSEFVSRATNFTNTKIDFGYQIHAVEKQVGVYGNLNDDSYSERWHKAVKGVFSTKKHEPLIRVYAPRDVAREDPTPSAFF